MRSFTVGARTLSTGLRFEDSGLDLLIYDEAGALFDVSYVPPELMSVNLRRRGGPDARLVIES
ncbi:hypothetical protein [Streptomyces sp. NPDC046860]|uniref:hypothetical protein n=1 Tax=Streptomyces sp. NPDC046860 TaxID=3154495 RepID=UPI0033FDB958